MKVRCVTNTMRTEDGKYICFKDRQGILTWSDFLILYPEIRNKILIELGYSTTEDGSYLVIGDKSAEELKENLDEIVMKMKNKLKENWFDIDNIESLNDNFVILNKEDFE